MKMRECEEGVAEPLAQVKRSIGSQRAVRGACRAMAPCEGEVDEWGGDEEAGLVPVPPFLFVQVLSALHLLQSSSRTARWR